MDAWKFVREDKAEYYRWLMMILPVARTPMSKRGGQAARNYSKRLDRAIEAMTPWTSASKFAALRRKYEKRMPEGSQIIVQFDANDNPESGLFKEAPTTGTTVKRKGS